MKWKYNEISMKEEKPQGVGVVCGSALLVRNLPHSAPKPLHCHLIISFSYIPMAFSLLLHSICLAS